MAESRVLKLLQKQALLLHAEVEQECLEELKQLVASGTVGCRALRTGVPDSAVYWKKRTPVSATPKPLPRKRQPRFISPLAASGTDNDSVPKRVRLTGPSTDSTPQHSEGGEGHETTVQQLWEKKQLLERKLKTKEEKLRKLEMVKLYRSKNDLGELDGLTEKWRQVAQEVAEALLCSSTRDPRPSMTEMLGYLHIDTALIKYSTEQESFY